MKFTGLKSGVVLSLFWLSFYPNIHSTYAATCIEKLEEQKELVQRTSKHVVNSCLAVGSIAATAAWDYVGRPYLKNLYPGTDILLDPICDSVEYLMYAVKNFAAANAVRSAYSDYRTHQKYKSLVPLTSISYQAYSILASMKDHQSKFNTFQIHFGKLDRFLTEDQKQVGEDAWNVLMSGIERRLHSNPSLVQTLNDHLTYLKAPYELTPEEKSIAQTENSQKIDNLAYTVASIIYYADMNGLLCDSRLDYSKYSWDKIGKRVKKEILTQTYLDRQSELAFSFHPYSSFKRERMRPVPRSKYQFEQKAQPSDTEFVQEEDSDTYAYRWPQR